MTDALKPPPKKNPLRWVRPALSPPAARSRAGLAFSVRAAEGRFMLQQCSECGAVAYPPRDACARCWSDGLEWRRLSPAGKLLAETALHASTNTYFRDRLPWRIGTVKLDAGPVVIAHLHGDVREGESVRLVARTDKAGEGVLMALPEKDTANMADDKTLRELTCDPKHRRVLVTDARTPLGQAVARAALKAGATKAYLGVAREWLPFEGREELLARENIEIAPLDLTDSDSVGRLASAIGGKVDILINTAQLARAGSAMSRRDVALAREEVETNLFGPMRLLQAFGPAMRARGADGVNSACAWVNILSVYALSSSPAFGVYSATQAAALSLSQGARADFKGSGVKVVNVYHGPIDDEEHQALPAPKVAPDALASGVISALREGVEDFYVGDVAKDIAARWGEDRGLLERELINRTLD